MGKKKVDPATMTYLKMAAWGVVDIEKLDRLQRRNYINRVRVELEPHGFELVCAGSKLNPGYRIVQPLPTEGDNDNKQVILGWTGVTAFKDVCLSIAKRIDPELPDTGNL
jgi:hypothetical protein